MYCVLVKVHLIVAVDSKWCSLLEQCVNKHASGRPAVAYH